MKSYNSQLIRIIGAGLAGSEAALILANHGIRVQIYEQKPKKFSAAHKLSGAAELVCSNSFKSTELTAAHGLLKEELKLLGSPFLKIAEDCRIPGGKSLTVDRELLSKKVTEALKSHPLIEWKTEEVTEISEKDETPTLIAAGPLCSESLSSSLQKLLGENSLYFYDATSPVVSLSSLDLSKFFWASRNQESEDYLNLPLTKEDYEKFWADVNAAEKVGAHLPEENLKFFEGCLPLEEIASRGFETLACSCMSPDGFGDKCPPNTYAVIQFRREKAAGELLSMVGFQTRMKWPEQERVFRSLPGMKEAEFMRLGAMHRNTFINTPLHLNESLQLKKFPQFYFAGQITGAEGYTEAVATGHYAALQMLGIHDLPEQIAIKSFVRFLVNSDPKYFQPMNFNFGLLPALDPQFIRKNKLRKKPARNLERSRMAIEALSTWIDAQSQAEAS